MVPAFQPTRPPTYLRPWLSQVLPPPVQYLTAPVAWDASTSPLWT